MARVLREWLTYGYIPVGLVVAGVLAAWDRSRNRLGQLFRRSQGGPAGRAVRIGLHDKRDPDTSHPLVRPGGEYLLWLELEPPAPQTRWSTEPAPIDVVVFPRSGGVRVNRSPVGRLHLDSTGEVVRAVSPGARPRRVERGERVYFHLSMPDELGTVSTRICLYYRGTLIRSYVFECVVTGDAQQPGGSRFACDYSISASIGPETLERLGQQQLSVLVNQQDGETHGLYVFGAAPEGDLCHVGRVSDGVLRETLDSARASLAAVMQTPGDGTADPARYRYDGTQLHPVEQLVGDLVALAKRGHRLWHALVPPMVDGGDSPYEAEEQLRKQVRAPARVEVASVYAANAVLPAALFYDYPLRDQVGDLRVCSAGVAAVTSGDPELIAASPCFQGRCDTYDDAEIVCPGGFWGFRHQVATPQANMLTPQDDTAEHPVVIDDRGSRTTVVGVSLDEKLRRRESHLRWLREHCEPVWHCVSDAKRLTNLLTTVDPHLVYLYCHGGVLTDGTPYLSLGQPQDPAGYLLPTALKGPRWRSGPLVVMNGCRTAALSPEQQLTFVNILLRYRGASAVVGSEVVVYEGLACDYLTALLTAMFHGASLGAATRRARLDVLAGGNPLGLAYTTFGHNGTVFASVDAAQPDPVR